jgi:hypothetical protein
MLDALSSSFSIPPWQRFVGIRGEDHVTREASAIVTSVAAEGYMGQNKTRQSEDDITTKIRERNLIKCDEV